MFVKPERITIEIKENLDFYYSEKGEKALYPRNIFEYAGNVLTSAKDDVIVVDNRLVCGGTRKILRKRSDLISTVENFSVQYRALKEAIEVLNARGVACFFFNRPGKKKDFTYDVRTIYRMKRKLNFPKMIQNIEKYDVDWKQIYGNYTEDYLKKLTKIPQIVKKDNNYIHEDCKTELVNVKDGFRVTPNQPHNSENRIYVYGRCGAFGYAVSDEECLPSQLQNILNQNGNTKYAVENRGLWGASDTEILHNFLLRVSDMRKGDIVVFYLKHFDFKILDRLMESGLWFENLTEPWHTFPEASSCFFDKPGHMNRKGYENAARLIFEYMKSKDFKPRKESNNGEILSASFLNDYIKSVKDVEFETNIQKYIDSIKPEVSFRETDENCGAIVMNCNPFTLGHRYLIEKACAQVDKLIIFVVEENRSFFKFEDRFQMVKEGTKDLENVYVVPSGRFIISALTFPEYFLKDYVKEKNFDVSNDVEIFCKYISPALNIKKRFAGEEPFDPVTNNYNNEMKNKLPMYGMEFVEIPRSQSDDGEVINATKVRKLMEEGKTDILGKYLPDSTIDILEKNYLKG